MSSEDEPSRVASAYLFSSSSDRLASVNGLGSGILYSLPRRGVIAPVLKAGVERDLGTADLLQLCKRG